MPPQRLTTEERRIQQPKQLLVDGNDPLNFFKELMKHLNCQDIQIQDYGGVDELPRFLRGFTGATGYSSVTSIGIVRDAEENGEAAAWSSVQSALQHANMPVPQHIGQRSAADPHVTVLILPGDGNPGMLETVLNQTFADDPVNACINDFFECVERLPEKRIHIPDKARARAYMWTRERPHVSVGVAAQVGYWDFDHEAFAPLRSFLTAL